MDEEKISCSDNLTQEIEDKVVKEWCMHLEGSLIFIMQEFGYFDRIKQSKVQTGPDRYEIPLADEIRHVFRAARGEGSDESRMMAFDSAQSICELLFSPWRIGPSSYYIPEWFWETDLGFAILALHWGLKDERLLTTSQAEKVSEKYGKKLSWKHLSRLCKNGDLEALWMKGKWRIKESSLILYIRKITGERPI